MKGVGMLVGNFGLNPERRPIWVWPKLFLTPKSNLRSGSIFVSLCNNIPAGQAKRKR